MISLIIQDFIRGSYIKMTRISGIGIVSLDLNFNELHLLNKKKCKKFSQPTNPAYFSNCILSDLTESVFNQFGLWAVNQDKRARG